VATKLNPLRNLDHLVPVFNSQLVVFIVCLEKEITLNVSVLVLPYILPLSWNILLLKSWNWLETLPVITKKLVSSLVIFN
jgi:hypothetical protein